MHDKNYTKMPMPQRWCLIIMGGKLTARVFLGSEMYTCASSCK